MSKSLNSEQRKAEETGLQPVELAHYAKLLLEVSPTAWKAFTKMNAADQLDLVRCGLVYGAERQASPPRALTKLAHVRISRGMSLDQTAKQINVACQKLLESLDSTIVSRYRGLLKLLPDYQPNIDLILLAEGDSDVRQQFRKAAAVDASAIKSIESGSTKPIRPEVQITVESFFGSKLDALQKPHRG